MVHKATRRRGTRLAACVTSMLIVVAAVGCGGDDAGDDAASDTTAQTGTDTTAQTGTDTTQPSEGTDSTAPSDSDAPTTTASEDEAKPGGEIEFLVYISPSSLDPKMNNPAGHAGAGQIYSIYDSLLRVASDGTVTPRLAESVTPDEDFSTWSLTLRAGVTFSDGTPFNAEAVKFNWDRHAKPEEGSQCILAARNIASSTVVSDTELTIELAQPNSQFPFLMQGCLGLIASPAAIQQYGAEYGTTADKTAGAGPFTLESFSAGTEYTLVRNASFWDAPRPYLERVHVVAVPSDPTVAAQALITGEAQMVTFGIATPAMNMLEEAGFEEHTREYYGGQGWVFNTAKPPLDDVRVRRALVLALDREAINQQAFAGQGALDATFFPESSPYYDPSLTYPEQDVAEAQRLIDEYLAETGTDSIDVTMIGLEGQMTSVAVTAQQALSQIEGVSLEFQPLPPLGIRDAVVSKSFDISAWLLSGDAVYPDLYDYLVTGSLRNASGFSSPVIDEALAAATASDDPEVIKESYQTVAREVLDQVPYAVLWRTHVSTYAQDHVNGLTVVNDNVVDLSTVWLDQ